MLKNDLVLALIEQFDKDLSAIELASKSAGGIFDALLSARDHLEESKKVMFAFSDSESRPSSPGDGNNDEAASQTSSIEKQNNSEESMQEEASNSNSVDDNNDVKSQSEETLANDPEQLANDEQEAAPKIILNDNYQSVQTEEGEKAESPGAENVSANTENVDTSSVENQPQVDNTDVTATTESEQPDVASNAESKPDAAVLDSAQTSLVPQTEALGNDAAVPDPA